MLKQPTRLSTFKLLNIGFVIGLQQTKPNYLLQSAKGALLELARGSNEKFKRASKMTTKHPEELASDSGHRQLR